MQHGPEPTPDDDFDGFDDFDDFGEAAKPVLITGAALSFEEQHRQRVRKYLTLMAFRIPALLLAAAAYGAWHNGLISLLIVAGSVPLPWIAVLIANDRPPRRADEPRRYEAQQRGTLFAGADRRALEPPALPLIGERHNNPTPGPSADTPPRPAGTPPAS